MTKHITTHEGNWKPGQSGNPHGRPPKHRALTEMLRLQGEEIVIIGSETMSAKEALAKAMWQFVLTGEVSLAGKRLKAETVNEWASAVKWLYGHIEPPTGGDPDEAPEMVVRVVRVDKTGE